MQSKSHRVRDSPKLKAVDHDPTDDAPLASLLKLWDVHGPVSSTFVAMRSFISHHTVETLKIFISQSAAAPCAGRAGCASAGDTKRQALDRAVVL